MASKRCRRLLWASVSQSSFSSGVRAMPWLGHPWRLVGPFSIAGDLDAKTLPAGRQVAHLETQQTVDVHEAKRLVALCWVVND